MEGNLAQAQHPAFSLNNKDACTGPITVWKIERNRLKTGYAPSEGDALIKSTASQLTLREASGKIVMYAIRSRH
jgi:hypothetical protein